MTISGKRREIWWARKKDSPKWRVRISSRERTEVRLILAFHLRRRSRYVETWESWASESALGGMKGARAEAMSAKCIGSFSHWRIFLLPRSAQRSSIFGK